ncbi:hypothetical protein RRG08_028226 [Elysia crispata]|uniref:Major facilitator superfamily (MFS) profile domain-containing protein n=1 Tax=Elysia crispata TaxID=231223 RepID=A0AAE1AT11_9GAST|nr:hypothetical protein RRG08_028226 [Elysia crispata]
MNTDNREQTAPPVEKILRVLNPTGRYQILHILSLMVAIPATAFQLLSNVFTAKAVPHRCAGPPQGSNWMEVFGDFGNLTVVREECRLVLMENSNVLDTAPCAYGIQYELPENTSVVSQFHLVCAMDWVARLSQMMLFLGQGIGAYLTSFFSDRFGRKTTIVTSNFGLLVCGLIVAFAPDPIIFMIFKFLIGGFQQGVLTVSVTYFLELLPFEKRSVQPCALGLVWFFSVICLALLSFIFQEWSWRFLQTILTLASLTVIFQWWYMDESLMWLMANGRTIEAMKVIRRIAKANKRYGNLMLDEVQITVRQMVDNAQQGTHSSSQEFEIEATDLLSLLDLFKVWKLLLNSLCMWFAWFTTALAFFTIYLTSTSLSGNPYLNFGLTALMELPSIFYIFFFLNRLGRKLSLKIAFGVMGVGVLLAGNFRSLENENPEFAVLTLLASLVAMFGASACFNIIFTYTSEIFPTNFRSQALGISSCIARIGGMLAPFAGLLAEQAVWAPGLIICLCSCIVCLLTRFLPETSGRELPQTISDLEAWFV